MAGTGCVVVVGATKGIGREIARHYADAGREVFLTGRDADEAASVARELGGRTTGLVLDLCAPHSIAAALAPVGAVDYLVLAAIDRDANTVHDYDIDAAIRLVTMKLVGFTEVVHQLLDRLSDDSSIVLFGGQAKHVPYPGSTTVSTVNGGVVGLTRTLAHELAPIRVNAIHPGIVGDSPFWHGKPESVLEGHRERTMTKRLATMEDIVDATRFLLENRSMEGFDLVVDNGAQIR
jgi:NAD(P)-dependent dehydrogenase (short-subunit alcohol dehydrogenase family)